MKFRIPAFKSSFLLIQLVIVFSISGCSISPALYPYEHYQKQAPSDADRVMVLARVVVESNSEEPFEPFLDSQIILDDIGVGVGDFETGGAPRLVDKMNFPSDAMRREGWFYIIATRGTVYFTFLPPLGVAKTGTLGYYELAGALKPWRVDIETNADLIYAGTMVIEADIQDSLFGQKIVQMFQRMSVIDESESAREIARQYLPEVDTMTTALMAAHSGPVVLNRPDPGESLPATALLRDDGSLTAGQQADVSENPDRDAMLQDLSGTYLSTITSSSKQTLDRRYEGLRLQFTQSGNKIEALDKQYETRISGEIDGDVIKFYVEANKITGHAEVEGEWRLHEDGKRFTGNWIARRSFDGASGTWDLVRID